MRQSISLLVVTLAAAFAFVGCSDTGPAGPEQLPTVPAGGTVMYRGTPIGNASVSFQRSDGKAVSVATTGADGKFSLMTYGDKAGAPAGDYRVTVAVSGAVEIEPGVLAPEPPGGFQSPIPLRYADPMQTDLVVNIPEAGNTSITLDLK